MPGAASAKSGPPSASDPAAAFSVRQRQTLHDNRRDVGLVVAVAVIRRTNNKTGNPVRIVATRCPQSCHENLPIPGFRFPFPPEAVLIPAEGGPLSRKHEVPGGDKRQSAFGHGPDPRLPRDIRFSLPFSRPRPFRLLAWPLARA